MSAPELREKIARIPQLHDAVVRARKALDEAPAAERIACAILLQERQQELRECRGTLPKLRLAVDNTPGVAR